MPFVWFPVRVVSVTDGDTFEANVQKLDGFKINYYQNIQVESKIISTSPSNLVIRIMNIDSPELTQPYGNESKIYLENLIQNEVVWCRQFQNEVLTVQELGRYVKIKTNLAEDRFGRQLCECFLRYEEFDFIQFDILNLETSVNALTSFYLSDSNIKTIIDEDLVSTGNAWNYEKYSTNPNLFQLQIDAENSNLGLWGCNPASIMYPADYRKYKYKDPNFTLPNC